MEQILKIILFSLLCYTFFKIKKNDSNKLKNDKGDELFSLLNNNKKDLKLSIYSYWYYNLVKNQNVKINCFFSNQMYLPYRRT